jgi:hypothetical protein
LGDVSRIGPHETVLTNAKGETSPCGVYSVEANVFSLHERCTSHLFA